MKTRRAFQIIVGVLSALVVVEIAIIALFVCVTALPISSLPEWMRIVFAEFLAPFRQLGSKIGSFAGWAYLIPIAAFGLPTLLLALGRY